MSHSDIRIRVGTPQDIPAITAIYNDAVANTTAIWNDQQVDDANRLKWMKEHQALGYDVLVAINSDSEVVGYATLSDWRAFDGYRHTVENSVYVRHDQRGNGVGKLLMHSLVEQARALDKHVIVAAIEGQNHASITLHEKLGFVNVGQLKEVGIKFGRWLDLVFLQLTL